MALKKSQMNYGKVLTGLTPPHLLPILSMGFSTIPLFWNSHIEISSLQKVG